MNNVWSRSYLLRILGRVSLNYLMFIKPFKIGQIKVNEHVTKAFPYTIHQYNVIETIFYGQYDNNICEAVS